MGTTQRGLWFPDRSTPMSLHAIVKQAQESTDAVLTPQVVNLPLVAPFAGSLRVFFIPGLLAIMAGGIQRPSWSGGSTHVATLVAGTAPVAATESMNGSTRTGEGSYQLSVQPDGRVMYQVSVATNNTNGVNFAWALS